MGSAGDAILTPFLQTMQADFSGDLQSVDFQHDPSGAVQTINNWVSQQTDSLIQNLLSSADVTTLTRLVLTNAIYFNGTWATAFDRQRDAKCSLYAAIGRPDPGLHDEQHQRVRLHG